MVAKTQIMHSQGSVLKERSRYIKNLIGQARILRGGGDIQAALDILNTVFDQSEFEKDLFLRNKILNEIELTQGNTVMSSLPVFLHVSLTNQCNVDCVMCPLEKRKKWDISCRMTDDLIGLMPYLEEINWFGGEVFYSKNFKKLFYEACKHGNLYQLISTNALMIDQKIAQEIVRERVKLSISIDGITSKTYESIHKGASYDKLIDTIHLINRNKRKLNDDIDDVRDRMVTIMHYVVMKSNFHEIPDILGFAAANDFDELHIFPVEGKMHDENIFVGYNTAVLDNIKYGVDNIIKQSVKHGISVFNCIIPDSEPQDSCVVRSQCRGVNRENTNDLFCYLPWKSLLIDVSEASPDCYCMKKIEKNDTMSIRQIWNSRDFQNYRKKMLNKDLSWCNEKCVSGAVPSRSLKII
ncbi:radical SAM protein [Elusimicrobiota bacterium]